MKFTKMQGCGNDYVYVDCFSETVNERPEMARRVSNRNYGIGSDGLICICPSDMADFKMDMYNADGSSSEMCGNGIRCLGKYVYDRGLTDKTVITVETGGGIRTLWLNLGDEEVESVRVCMGKADFKCENVPIRCCAREFVAMPFDADGITYTVTALSVGNPHAVVFVEDPEALDLTDIGPRFEKHSSFTESVNTEFAKVLDRNTIQMRVWERGSGETLACGTGATATFAAAHRLGLVDSKAKLILRGGELEIELDNTTGELYMTGPAQFVFDGELL